MGFVRRHLPGYLAASMLCLAVPVHAQTDTARVILPLLMRVDVGRPLRVHSAETVSVGPFRRVTTDSLVLDDAAFSLNSLSRVDVRGRSTWRGTKIGAIAGAVGFGAFGAFISTIAAAESGDAGGGELAFGAIIGGAMGTLVGGAVGAVVGAATPRWVDITDKHAPLPTTRRDGGAPRRIGSLSITPAYAHSASSSNGGVGVRASYLFTSAHFALGPEFGIYNYGSYTYNFTDTGTTLTQPLHVSHTGLLARVGAGGKNIEPFVTVSSGLFRWSESQQYLGYSAGGGINVRNPSKRISAFAEGRWHSNLSRTGDATNNLAYYTIGVGGALAW